VSPFISSVLCTCDVGVTFLPVVQFLPRWSLSNRYNTYAQEIRNNTWHSQAHKIFKRISLKQHCEVVRNITHLCTITQRLSKMFESHDKCCIPELSLQYSSSLLISLFDNNPVCAVRQSNAQTFRKIKFHSMFWTWTWHTCAIYTCKLFGKDQRGESSHDREMQIQQVSWGIIVIFRFHHSWINHRHSTRWRAQTFIIL
jgi:hypothetical protein